MGADLKQRIVESVRSTWASINSFAQAHRGGEATVEETVDSALQQLSEEEERAETECMCL